MAFYHPAALKDAQRRVRFHPIDVQESDWSPRQRIRPQPCMRTDYGRRRTGDGCIPIGW
jgi:hypothetical protein